jgi:N6-adenosine-specific RNA methylase IME4
MTMDDIRNLPVRDITEDNAICFMWITDPLIPKQIQLMEDWGFKYKTMGFVWTKLNKKSRTPFIGLGYYTRSNEEYCIIGTKGKIGRPKDRSISQSVQEPIREHSRKPDIIRTYIERMYPDGNRLEMFARTQYPGWDVFGNQVDKFTPEETITSLYESD